MDKFNPLVSIVIPVYNGSNYMCEAIDSAIAQSYKNIEIIVVNDGSDDNGETDKIALSYGDKIRYFAKQNGGVASALNIGIENMLGEYFSWLSHDDMYLPDKIAKQISCLDSLDDKNTLISCPYMLVDKKGIEFYRKTPFDIYTNEELSRPLFALLHGQIGGCCLLIHRSYFERYGRFDIERSTTQDFALWFSMMRENKVVFVRDTLVQTRSHEEQASKTMINDHMAECNVLWVDLIKKLSHEEMCLIDSSVYKFFKRMYTYLFLCSTHKEAIIYTKQQLYKALKENKESRNWFQQMKERISIFGLGQKAALKEVFLSIRKAGILSTFKRIKHILLRIIKRKSKKDLRQ